MHEREPDSTRRARRLFVLPVFILACGAVLAIAGNLRGGAFFLLVGLVFLVAVAVTVRRESQRAPREPADTTTRESLRDD